MAERQRRGAEPTDADYGAGSLGQAASQKRTMTARSSFARYLIRACEWSRGDATVASVRSEWNGPGSHVVGHSSLIAAVTSELTATAWCEIGPLACGASRISMDRRESGLVVGGEDKCTSARRHRKNYTRQHDRSCSRAPTFNKWCESDDSCHQL